jgi:hypothetical protein
MASLIKRYKSRKREKEGENIRIENRIITLMKVRIHFRICDMKIARRIDRKFLAAEAAGPNRISQVEGRKSVDQKEDYRKITILARSEAFALPIRLNVACQSRCYCDCRIQIWLQWKLWWKWRIFDASDWEQKKKEHYSSPLGYNVSRKTGSLISLTRDSHSFSFAQFLHSSLVLIRLTRPSILQSNSTVCDVVDFSWRFTSLHENNPRNTCIG